MIKLILKNTTRIIPATSYRFATNKISDLIEQLSSKIHEEQLVKDEKEEAILRNYIELTEESYLEHLMHENKLLSEQKRRVDPSIILMALPTLEKEQAIREHLLLLFPHVSTFQAKELLLFFQYLLAHKMTARPKLPSPKPLAGCEGLLVILAELYPKDFLVEWLKQVPLYAGNNTYMLAMAAFSVISGLSEKTKTAQQRLLERCFSRIKQLFDGEDSEMRSGVMLLALQANLKFAQELVLQPYCLDFKEIDGIKISLLIIELDRYIKQHYEQIKSVNPRAPIQRKLQPGWQDVEIDEGVDRQGEEKEEQHGFVYSTAQPGHIKFKLELFLLKLVRALTYQDWKGVIKLHTLVRLFQVLSGKKLEGGWFRFSEKLFNYTANKEQISAMTNLTSDEVLCMLQVLERLKVNRPPLVKALLVVLSQRLDTASKEEMIRLARCLVTYVRLCEDYLLHFRVVLQRRKFIFSAEDIEKLNHIFRRVQVLFPKPLTY